MEEVEFKLALMNYVRGHFKMTVDNEEIHLDSGGVKLGSHQTDIRFIIPSLPQEYDKVEISAPLFEENLNHHSIFRFNDGTYEIRKVLSQANGFRFGFERTAEGFEDVSEEHSNTTLLMVIVVVGFILLLGFRRYSSKKSAQLQVE